MTDFWNSPRHRVLKGQILLDNGATHTDCLLHNVSRTGATVRVSHSATLPPVFPLLVEGTHRVVCSVVRRTTIELAVHFLPQRLDAEGPM